MIISLREYTESDLEPLLTLANNAEVSKYLASSFPYPYRQADAALWMSAGRKNGFQKVIDVDG